MNRTDQDNIRDPPSRASPAARIIVIVEGSNDIEFLRRMSLILHAHDRSLPHLADMEQCGELIFVPCGGSVATWASRLQPLALPEFHLYDRELPPETEYRQQAVQEISRRSNCEAVLTGKRAIENYLHDGAISAAADITIDVDDFGSVAERAAQASYRQGLVTTPWELLNRRARKRMTQRAKRWLNTRAVDHMSVDMLNDRDPDGEVVSWFNAIRRLARSD